MESRFGFVTWMNCLAWAREAEHTVEQRWQRLLSK
jgi:hypothetical protein